VGELVIGNGNTEGPFSKRDGALLELKPYEAAVYRLRV
jgi:hypothetical protein